MALLPSFLLSTLTAGRVPPNLISRPLPPHCIPSTPSGWAPYWPAKDVLLDLNNLGSEVFGLTAEFPISSNLRFLPFKGYYEPLLKGMAFLDHGLAELAQRLKTRDYLASKASRIGVNSAF